MLPDVASAERTMQDLFLARIEERRIHCRARHDSPFDNLPEANFLRKTDVLHGAGTGIAIGGITRVLGTAFGISVTSMAVTAMPNSRLATLAQNIEKGKMLMMVDVSFTQSHEIVDLIRRRHTEAVSVGTGPTIPASP